MRKANNIAHLLVKTLLLKLSSQVHIAHVIYYWE